MIRAVILRYKTSKTDQSSQSYLQIPDLAVGGGASRQFCCNLEYRYQLTSILKSSPPPTLEYRVFTTSTSTENDISRTMCVLNPTTAALVSQSLRFFQKSEKSQFCLIQIRQIRL